MSKLTDSIDQARAASRERLGNAKELASEKMGSAKELASESLDSAKDIASEGSIVIQEKMSESKQRASELLGDAKARASKSIAVTKESAQKVAQKSEETFAKNPLTVVLGGLALGAIFAAFLPKTKTETKYIGGAARKINETAKKAMEAAKEAGQEQISELGLNSDTIRNQFKDWFGKAIEAAKSAAVAAQDAVKDEKQGK